MEEKTKKIELVSKDADNVSLVRVTCSCGTKILDIPIVGGKATLNAEADIWLLRCLNCKQWTDVLGAVVKVEPIGRGGGGRDAEPYVQISVEDKKSR